MEDGGEDLLQCVEESVALLVWCVEASGAPNFGGWRRTLCSNARRKVSLCWFGVLKRVDRSSMEDGGEDLFQCVEESAALSVW